MLGFDRSLQDSRLRGNDTTCTGGAKAGTLPPACLRRGREGAAATGPEHSLKLTGKK